jgi:hypothetical protein
MNDTLEPRLNELRQEAALGAHRLREIDSERVRLEETLLRIEGAIQVISEMAQGANADEPALNGDERAPAAVGAE